MKSTVYVVGGDLRQITVAELLSKDGFSTAKIGLSETDDNLSKLKNADIVVLPIPVSYDNVYINAPMAKKKLTLAEVLDNIAENALVLGACISEEVCQMLEARKLKYTDYYKREELIIKNAVPTAEGAIEIALAEMPITLSGSRALVMGYGRVGKILSKKLSLLGAYVTVSARKCSDFAWIEENGMRAVHTKDLIGHIDEFDLIINTIPAVILTEEILCRVSDDALIIDLASKPGGVDFNTAKKLGKNVIWALSLPGKVAPISSGRIIEETIINILAETGV